MCVHMCVCREGHIVYIPGLSTYTLSCGNHHVLKLMKMFVCLLNILLSLALPYYILCTLPTSATMVR